MNQQLWFTADHHFGHANIIRHCNRPFASAEEMDAALTQLWNETVGPSDLVYHLGDFTLQPLDKFKAIARQLNGQLKIVPGSHDRRWLAQFQADDPDLRTAHGHAITLLPPLVSLEIPDMREDHYPQVIVLCHYALRVWDRSHYGSWHLYGHSHGHLPGLVAGRGRRLSWVSAVEPGRSCREAAVAPADHARSEQRITRPIVTGQVTDG